MLTTSIVVLIASIVVLTKHAISSIYPQHRPSITWNMTVLSPCEIFMDVSCIRSSIGTSEDSAIVCVGECVSV